MFNKMVGTAAPRLGCMYRHNLIKLYTRLDVFLSARNLAKIRRFFNPEHHCTAYISTFNVCLACICVHIQNNCASKITHSKRPADLFSRSRFVGPFSRHRVFQHISPDLQRTATQGNTLQHTNKLQALQQKPPAGDQPWMLCNFVQLVQGGVES